MTIYSITPVMTYMYNYYVRWYKPFVLFQEDVPLSIRWYNLFVLFQEDVHLSIRWYNPFVLFQEDVLLSIRWYSPVVLFQEDVPLSVYIRLRTGSRCGVRRLAGHTTGWQAEIQVLQWILGPGGRGRTSAGQRPLCPPRESQSRVAVDGAKNLVRPRQTDQQPGVQPGECKRARGSLLACSRLYTRSLLLIMNHVLCYKTMIAIGLDRFWMLCLRDEIYVNFFNLLNWFTYNSNALMLT